MIVPDNPEHGVLYLVRATLNAINKYPWDKNQPIKTLVLIDAIKMFSTACQEVYPYGYEHLESNDVLYGLDEKFIAEICSMTGTMVNLVLDHVNYFDEIKSNEASIKIKIQLFFVIINFGNLEEKPDLKLLAVTLGQMIQSSETIAKKEKDAFQKCCLGYKGVKGDKNIKKIVSKIGI